jgi:8-oxo-dGTP diphosphatase
MIHVTCAIILNGNRVLVTQRSETMPLPLKWEFPGGKLHEGETEEECIVREIKEELAIDIRIIKKLTSSSYDYGTFSINLIPFLAEYINGEIHLLEHRQAKWLNKEELAHLDWAPADIPILNELLHSEHV